MVVDSYIYEVPALAVIVFFFEIDILEEQKLVSLLT